MSLNKKAFPFNATYVDDSSFQSMVYRLQTLWFCWQMKLFVIQLYIVKDLDLLAPYWAEEIIQEFKKQN